MLKLYGLITMLVGALVLYESIVLIPGVQPFGSFGGGWLIGTGAAIIIYGALND